MDTSAFDRPIATRTPARSMQITLRNVHGSTPLARQIRQHCARLDRLCPDILSTRVQVEQTPAQAPDDSHPFVVSLRIGIPGRELVAHRGHDTDVRIALSHAFDAMARQLRETARRVQPGYAGTTPPTA
jgi:ribosome-associated translation inhibitor RaiA